MKSYLREGVAQAVGHIPSGATFADSLPVIEDVYSFYGTGRRVPASREWQSTARFELDSRWTDRSNLDLRDGQAVSKQSRDPEGKSSQSHGARFGYREVELDNLSGALAPRSFLAG